MRPDDGLSWLYYAGAQSASSPSKPETLLAELIGRELQVYPDAYSLRRFIERHWSRVSALAHKIHDEADRYAYLAAGDG